MEIKPIKLGAVQPIKVQPVQIQPVQAIKTDGQPNGAALMGSLFGEQAIKNKEVNEKKTAIEATKEERQGELKKAVQAATTKGNKAEEVDGDEEPKAKAKPKKKYTGPREVKVYGMTLYTEENADITLEEIRQKIVTEYHYPEFSASRTVMTFDEETGIIVPVIKFEKKG